MSYGKLNPHQREVLNVVIQNRQVTDLGAGDCELAHELLRLGARGVLAVDKTFQPRVESIQYIQSYFNAYTEAIETAFLSWPPNWNCPGLIDLLDRADVVAYLGKNTDGTACGYSLLFEYLVSREVVAYVPDRRNTLIVYGSGRGKRAPLGEEYAGLNTEDWFAYEDVENLCEKINRSS